jgi:hypothetical protein
MKGTTVPRIVMFAALGLAAASAADAAQRTFVATTGNDAWPCSLTQPCRTFAAALVNTNFGGDIVTLDSGGYGPVVIDKPLAIVVPPGVYAGVSVNGAQVDGIVVNVAGGGTVALRGLTISGQGGTNGVRFQQGGRLVLEDLQISGFFNGGNGAAIRNESTTPYSSMTLRRVSLRDSDAGIRIDGTTTTKAVTIENSALEALGPACISQVDDVNMTVRDTTLSDCATAFSVTQSAANFGYAFLGLERVTITRTYTAALQILNNATNRAPVVSVNASAMLRTGGIKATNGPQVSVSRSTIDGCGPGPCIDAGGTFGFVQFMISDTDIRRGPGGIRLSLDGTAGGIVNLADSRMTQLSTEAIYLRGAVNGAQLNAVRNMIDSNNRGIAVDTNGQVKLMGNQIVYNSTGGLVKLSQTNTYIESLNNNYIASNGWVQGSPPDEIPAISPTR